MKQMEAGNEQLIFHKTLATHLTHVAIDDYNEQLEYQAHYTDLLN